MFQNLYRLTLSLAESPHAPWALGIIAFAESSFFPVPPDTILIPMSLARPKRAWFYALICTIGSVGGCSSSLPISTPRDATNDARSALLPRR